MPEKSEKKFWKHKKQLVEESYFLGSPFCFGVKNSQLLENTGFEGNYDVNDEEMTKEVAKA